MVQKWIIKHSLWQILVQRFLQSNTQKGKLNWHFSTIRRQKKVQKSGRKKFRKSRGHFCHNFSCFVRLTIIKYSSDPKNLYHFLNYQNLQGTISSIRSNFSADNLIADRFKIINTGHNEQTFDGLNKIFFKITWTGEGLQKFVHYVRYVLW